MDQGPGTIRQHWPIALILAAFLALGIVYDVATPLFEKPDEMWHYPYVKWLGDGQGLPVQDLARTQPLMRQEATQPPLYYVTAALATFWIEDDHWQDLVWLNPFWGYSAPGTVNDNKNRVLHTDRERFPYRGAVLAIRLARLVSVIWGGITVLATYLIGLELFPKWRSFAAGAAALVAFNPQFVFIASAVSNDSAVSALCTLALLMIVKIVNRKSKIENRDWVSLGLVLGLALLAKASALALLPLAVVAIAVAACLQTSEVLESTFAEQISVKSNDLPLEEPSSRPRRSSHSKCHAFLKGCIIVFGIVALIAGWWYTLNWRLHGDPLGVQIHQEIVGPGRPELTLAQLVHELSQMELSFWAAFGWGNVHAHSWMYTALRIAVRLGALGLVIMAIGELRKPKLEKPTRLGLALLLLWGLLVFVALLRWLQWIFAPSGRHLFPAISSIAILLLLGLRQFVPSRLQGKATVLLAGAMFVFASICPVAYIVPAYARPPLLSEAAIEAIPHRLDVNFGGVMKLLGYEQPISNIQYPISNTLKPGDSLTVTLYWQSSAKINRDYAVFVHLLDENDLVLAQRNTFPGLGSFPTTLWQAGDAIADTYTLMLPETTYAPGSAQLEVGLYDFATGERLLVYGTDGEPAGDNVRFGKIEVLPRSETGLPNPVHFNFGGKVALVGYEMDRRKAEPGEAIRLTLYWQGLAKMRDDYTVFVHLLREGDQIWAGADRQPQTPTSTWARGQIVVDEYELVIAPDAPPDVYEVEVGLYLPETGERLNLLDQDGRLIGNRVLLSKVRVE
ncbi:MAG: DUF2142 domain-containing protein [Chloroflexi bacterium]|nr:DUF2142 domain-containing protein [Chloroflexota bacterium]